MKVMTKEEEQRHYNAVLSGGIKGALLGTGLGAAGVLLATRRYHAFRSLTIPFRAFLVASTGTFVGVIAADRSSAAYDEANNPEKQRLAKERRDKAHQMDLGKTSFQRMKQWAEDNRYPIVFGFWVLSLGGSFAMVNRNRYLSGAQKLVQARMYAQGFTLAVLLASFAMESKDAAQGTGRWETVKVLDPNDPEHKHLIEKRVHKERYEGEDQWMEMVEAEEARIKARKEAAKAKVHEKEAQQAENKAAEKSSAK